MYDYGLSVLSHYGLTASGTMRVRGALLCHTEQGDKLISEFGTAAEKLEQRYLLQCRITESGLLRCDQILRNEEGALATRGDDGGTYIVRNWYPGRECETGNSEDLIRASDALARLHTAAHLPVKMEYRRESIVEECIRHNVEIRKIRKYLQTKKKKNEFEKLLLASAGPYLEQGERAAAEMKASSYEKLRQRADEEGAVCHGEFSQFCGRSASPARNLSGYKLPAQVYLRRNGGQFRQVELRSPGGRSWLFYAENSGKTRLERARGRTDLKRLQRQTAAR